MYQTTVSYPCAGKREDREYTCMRKFVPLLLLIPLLLINVPNAHDWGDDFAQYLIQARNMLEAKAQTDNGLVFDTSAGQFAVQAYPVGFPLVLAPVFAFAGYEIRPFLILESLFLIGLGLLLVRYYKRFFSEFASILLVLILVYNPFLLEQKGQILSEFPFTFWLVLLILLHDQNKTSIKHFLILGLVVCLMISTRIIGVVALPALLLHYFFLKKNDVDSKLKFRLKSSLIVIAFSILFFLFLNSLLFPVPLGNFFGFYKGAGESHPFMIQEAFLLYLKQLNLLFMFPESRAMLLNDLLGIFILIGWFRALIKQKNFSEWFFLFYIVVLLLYPYLNGGYRMLIPIVPLMARYIFETLQALLSLTKIKQYRIALILFLGMFLYQPFTMLYATVKAGTIIPEGPQTPEAKEMIQFVREKTPENAVIVFLKARAMSFYTQRHTTYRLELLSEQANDSMFQRIHVTHLVKCIDPNNSELNNSSFEKYFSVNADRYTEIWRNRVFAVYERKN